MGPGTPSRYVRASEARTHCSKVSEAQLKPENSSAHPTPRSRALPGALALAWHRRGLGGGGTTTGTLAAVRSTTTTTCNTVRVLVTVPSAPLPGTSKVSLSQTWEADCPACLLKVGPRYARRRTRPSPRRERWQATSPSPVRSRRRSRRNRRGWHNRYTHKVLRAMTRL